MPRYLTTLLALLCGLLLSPRAFAANNFPDPAPPQPASPPKTELPKPQPHPDLTSHAPPRPLAKDATTEDWPSFLGPRHNLTSAERPLLRDLPPAGPPLVWEVKKGAGYSAPAVFDGRLILFHRVNDEEVVDCLAADTGQRYWRFTYPTAYNDRYGWSDGPRCAPVIDPATRLVFTYGAEGKLHCLLLDTGQLLWRRDLPTEFHIPQNFFGIGDTPLVEGTLLIINIGAPRGPTVAAFDTRTGKLAWGAGTKWGPSYATPIPATLHGRRRILVFAGGESRPPTGGLLCIDPTNGKVDFSFPWRSHTYESVNASPPLVLPGDRVFISECYGKGAAAVQVNPDGSAQKSWESNDLGTHFMLAAYREGHLYGADGHGPLACPLVCLDANTGKELWRTEPQWSETFDAHDGQGPRQHDFSPARCNLLQLADGRTLLLGEFGHLALLDLNPKAYNELSRSHPFTAAETWTPPVLSHGLLYINQNSRDPLHNTNPRLLCFDFHGN